MSSDQYFDEHPDVGSDPVTVDVTLPDVAYTVTTDRGVFSRGRLDPGTSMLLRADLPLAPAGDVLDLGCGAGPIAMAMALRSPHATVWAVDVNRRARSLTRQNAERNGIANVHVAAPGEVPPDVRFATIWSNPPIRIGKDALHAMLSTWLGRLADEGTAAIVVQKHLGADSLHRWLDQHGHAVRRHSSKAGYRLLTIERRP